MGAHLSEECPTFLRKPGTWPRLVETFYHLPCVLPLLATYPENQVQQRRSSHMWPGEGHSEETLACSVGHSLRGSWAASMTIGANITPCHRAWEDSGRGLHQDMAWSLECIFRLCAKEYQDDLQATLPWGSRRGEHQDTGMSQPSHGGSQCSAQ